MASISTQLNLVDRMSAPMYSIMGAVNQVISTMAELDSATDRGFNPAQIDSARRSIDLATVQVDEMVAGLQKQEQQQDKVNKKIHEGSSAMDGMARGVMSMVGAYASWQGVQKLVTLSDAVTQTTARLGNLDAKLAVTQDQIFAVAQSSRAGFMQTGDMIAKMGLQAEKAFDSGKELLTFGELLNKSMVNAGTSTQGMDSVMLQLTQSMAAGVLQGEELNALLDNAQPIVANIQRYLEEVQNIDASNIKDLASQGVITADVIKNAMFYAADDINKQFESMPVTWGQVWTGICNQAIMVSQPLLNLISLMAQNWDVLAPIVGGVAMALSTYIVLLGIHKGLVLASAIATGFHATTTVAASIAAMQAATTQSAFNAALFACPITWIVIAIVAFVAILIAVCTWLAKTAGIANSAFGVIAGGLNVAKAAIVNLGLIWANIVLGIWNAFCLCCTNVGTAFNNVITGMQGRFYGLLSTALTVVSGICEALNRLPFVEFDYSGISSMAADYAGKSAEAHGKWQDYASDDEFLDGFNTFETFKDGWASDAFEAGSAWGDGISEKVGGFLGGGAGADIGDYGMSDFSVGGDTLDDIADNTGATADGISASDEELKYLRDLAEREAINRYTTAEIKVDMGGITNHVSKDTDVDGVIDYLTRSLQQAMVSSAEGVHA